MSRVLSREQDVALTSQHNVGTRQHDSNPRQHGITTIGIVRRELLLSLRRRTEVVTTLFFFVVVSTLFPLAISPDPAILRNLASGVLWVAALLACMLSLPRLFAADYADGSLEQMVLAPSSLALLILKKIYAHWLVSGLPIVLLSPLLGLQYALPTDALLVLFASLLLGTPILSLIGAIGAALTLGVRGSDLLLPLLMLPLLIPVLILGSGAVAASLGAVSPEAHFSLLGAYLLVSIVLAPWVAAVSVRLAVE